MSGRSLAAATLASALVIFVISFQNCTKKISQSSVVNDPNPRPTGDPFTVRIQRLSEGFSEAGVPYGRSWVEGEEETASDENPLELVAAGGTKMVYSSWVPGFQVQAFVCFHDQNSSGCESPAQYQRVETSCVAGKCSANLSPPSGKVTEVAFTYKRTLPLRQKNIIIIMTDDQRWDTVEMEAAGDRVMPFLKTHMIDQGVLFKNSFVSSPLCCPSRASFLSGGFYPKNSQVDQNGALFGGFKAFKDRDALATKLKAAGYTTAFFGKYLNYYVPGDDPYVPPGWDIWHGGGDDYGDATATRRYANMAVDFIQSQRNATKPFFIYLSFYKPHLPVALEPEDQKRFQGFTPPRLPNYREADMSDKPAFVRGYGSFYVGGEWTEEKRDADWLGQVRSLAAIDRSVNQVFDSVRGINKENNTAFVYMSDNGYHWGEHNLVEKQYPYEEDIRVPLIIRTPETRPRVEERMVTANIDVPATILDWAGIVQPSDGYTLQPLFDSEGGSFRNYIYSEMQPLWVGLRTKSWKYVEWYDGKIELYDLENDPYEMQSLDLSDKPNHVDKRTKLKQILAKISSPLVRVQNLVHGVVNQPLSITATAFGGSGKFTWSTVPKTLPAGLNLNAKTGIISGTPTVATSVATNHWNGFFVVEDKKKSRYTKEKIHASSFGLKFVIAPAADRQARGAESAYKPGVAEFDGAIHIADGKKCRIAGFAADPGDLSRMATVSLRLDSPTGPIVATGLADQFVPDDEDPPAHKESHGFDFTLKIQGKHEILLEISDSEFSTILSQEPTTITCQ